MIKKLIIPFFCLFFMAACSKEEPIAMQANPQAAAFDHKQRPQGKYPACNATYAENLRACTPYICQQESALPGGLGVIRTIKEEENGQCTEEIALQPAPTEAVSPAPAEQDPATQNTEEQSAQQGATQLLQTCRFTQEQRAKMADYLLAYFTAQAEPNSAADMPENPLKDFLQNGTCTAQGFHPQGEITCTGTQSITVITTDANGTEISHVITCQNEEQTPAAQ